MARYLFRSSTRMIVHGVWCCDSKRIAMFVRPELAALRLRLTLARRRDGAQIERSQFVLEMNRCVAFFRYLCQIYPKAHQSDPRELLLRMSNALSESAWCICEENQSCRYRTWCVMALSLNVISKQC